MITVKYICDICLKEIKDNNNDAVRIKFFNEYDILKNNIAFCSLHDDSASQKILCKKCIDGIKEAKFLKL